MKKNKILIALGMIGSIAIADAQWAVTNINDKLIWGPTGIQTQIMGNMNSLLDTGMQAQSENQKIQIAQNNFNMAVQDSRQRRSLGLAEIARQDDALRPSITQCAEVSANSYKYASVGNIYNSGRSSGNNSPAGQPPSYDDAALAITNSATNQVLILKQMNELGTCAKEYGKTAKCSGSDGSFARADTTSLSLKTNMKNTPKGVAFNNWSIDEQGQAVGKKYITDATLNDGPRFPSSTQLEKNPGYLTLYNAVATKLKAAQDVLTEILNFSSGNPLGGIPETIWKEAKPLYAQIFGPKAVYPSNPSSFEVINFTVYRDYIIAKTGLDDHQLNEDRNRLLSVNNYLLFQQFKAQQNTNILLSHLLVQSVSPVNKDALNAEYNKTVALK